jgi:hypothetical protein
VTVSRDRHSDRDYREATEVLGVTPGRLHYSQLESSNLAISFKNSMSSSFITSYLRCPAFDKLRWCDDLQVSLFHSFRIRDKVSISRNEVIGLSRPVVEEGLSVRSNYV